MSGAFVDVALPLPIPRPLTYAVPDGLAPRATPGSRVVVPVQSREMVGVVTASGRPPPAASPREVLAAPDREPLLDQGLLRLAAWMARHYGAPPGLAVRAMLPAALFSAGRPVVRVAAGELPAGGAGPALERLLAGRQGRSGLSLRAVRRAAGGAGLRLLHRLAAEGAAEFVTIPPRTSTPERRERVLELVRPLPLLERERRFARAARQRQAYETLERMGGRAAAGQLSELGLSGSALRALVASGVLRQAWERRERDPFLELAASPPPAEPTAAQRQALASLRELEAGTAALLFGVTGSGKTLVYLEYLRRLVDEGRGAIVLVPEIALTPQTVARMRGVFGDQVAVLHSALSEGERYDAWRALKEGRRKVAVGARSAVFAALPRLGALVVDEEHDPSYKQGEAPRYHAREVALARARLAGARVVLGSATPALETWAAAQTGRIRLVALPERVEARPLPPVEVVDLRGAAPREAGPVPWSETLERAVAGALARGEQAMLLLNRRGFSVFVQCPACGEVWDCPNCSITLTYHRSPPALRCHHCGHRESPPERCRVCGAITQRYRGAGTQQVEAFVAARFQEARVERMDVDATAGKWAHHRILDRVARGEVDVLVGTQMIAKGLDFPSVTVVGVVDADVALALPDFRASERTFALVTQVAGRAGRGPRGGKVVVQTRRPDHPAIRYAARHDVAGWAAQELEARRQPPYPPHAELANLVLSGANQRQVAEAAVHLREWLEALFRARPSSRCDLLGPAPCPIARVRERWRWHVLLRSADPSRITRVVSYVSGRAPERRGVRLVVDRDPVSLL
jgi:primosomal protein N' (replication factor Y)